MQRALPALALILACLAATAAAPQQPDLPGRTHRIRPQDLPRPFATGSFDNPPALVAAPPGTLPRVPAGFRVGLFAASLGGVNSPRLMAQATNGDLFVSLSGDNRVMALRDADGDGAAEQRFEFAGPGHGLYLPFGLAFDREWLYVANTSSVVRFRYRPGQTRAEGGPEVVIAGIPERGYNQHWTRDIVFSPDGRKLYLSIGSETNLGEEPPLRAAIHEYNPDGSGYRRYASGIRNPVGLAFHPATGDLWCTCNERDGLGDDLVPDYFTSVREGGFYGWPYSYIGRNSEPRLAGGPAELIRAAIVPDVLFQAHSAALGCAFYTGAQFPAEYKNDAFVAFHGSWNRSLRTGYKVVRVRFQGGRARGDYEDFMTGFLLDSADRNVWGRPVGVLPARDGSLLVADDGGHCIWRVTYPRK